MMTKMFEPQLGKNIKVYIDDMVVKSKLVSEHLADLTSIFEILREHKLHLNASLNEAEVRYLPLENAILAVVHATRKLPHYFQAHTVVMLTQVPLKSVLISADYTGRIAKWGTILGTFDIKYMPRTSIKGQVLANLVTEFAKCPE